MSLVLAFCDRKEAVILTDGMARAKDGRIVRRDFCKFFRTAAGHVVASAGWTKLQAELENRFATSTRSFLELVNAVEGFVRERCERFEPTPDVGRPLGAILAGLANGRPWICEIGPGGTNMGPFRHFAWVSIDGAEEEIRKVGDRLISNASADAQSEVRALAHRLAEKFPDFIGGEFFEARLPEPEVSSFQNGQGSQNSAGDNAAFSWAITSSSVDFWWSAFTLPYLDGSTVSVAADGSSSAPAIDFTGLTSSTSYYFSARYNLTTKAVQMMKSTAVLTPQQNITWYNADGYIPVFSNVEISTPSSGGSGGGSGGTGGGSCFTGEVRVKTTEGLKRFDEMNPVERIVNETGTHVADLIIHDADEEVLQMPTGGRVTPYHLFKRDGWARADNVFRDASRSRHTGKLFNLEVRSKNERDKHYVLESGKIVHNFKTV